MTATRHIPAGSLNIQKFKKYEKNIKKSIVTLTAGTNQTLPRGPPEVPIRNDPRLAVQVGRPRVWIG